MLRFMESSLDVQLLIAKCDAPVGRYEGLLLERAGNSSSVRKILLMVIPSLLPRSGFNHRASNDTTVKSHEKASPRMGPGLASYAPGIAVLGVLPPSVRCGVGTKKNPAEAGLSMGRDYLS